MARKHYIKPTVPNEASVTVRLGAGQGSSNNLSDKDNGKLVKYVGESRYDLCAAGDDIEGVITSVESATQDQYSIGGVALELELLEVTFDGLQATPGTGVIAVGDYVVAGTITAKGTALAAFPKVCKATQQPFGTFADLAAAATGVKHALFAWRVESLGSAGSGAVGTTGVIRRVS